MNQKYRITKNEGNDYLSIKSANIKESIDYFNQNNFYGITMSRHHGYEKPDLDFITELVNLKGIIVSDDISDFTAIYSQLNLEYLAIGTPKKPIDFTAFKQLHTFRGKWSNKIAGISESKSLKNLALWSYKSKSKNLFELSNLKQLQYLELVSTHIESLDGIAQFTNLGELNLHYLSKLNDISAMSALNKHLTHIHFENCKKIASYQPLAQCRALQRITLEKCANIQSLDFVNTLQSLRQICWTRTKLECEADNLLAAKHIEKVIGFNGRFIKGSNP